MISPISGMSPVASQPVAPAQTSPQPSAPAVNTQDTVTLSHAGQQAARASADVDRDGDSH